MRSYTPKATLRTGAQPKRVTVPTRARTPRPGGSLTPAKVVRMAKGR